MNFTSLKLGDPQCYAPRRLDYVDKLLVQTIAPIFVNFMVIVAGGLHLAAVRRRVFDDEEERKKKISAVLGRYLSMFFLVIYLVLPGVTNTIAGVIPTINADPDGLYPDKNYYFMRNDLSISVTSSRYRFCLAWAAFMFAVYPVGVPCLYFFVLYINRDKIRAKPSSSEEGTFSRREPNGGIRSPTSDKRVTTVDRIREYITPQTIHFLHGTYDGEFWYWEILETSRRLFLTALLSIVASGTMVCLLFYLLKTFLNFKFFFCNTPFHSVL